MSRPNKKKAEFQPLETINQKPGNEDSSFLVTDDDHRTLTASLPLSSDMEPQSNGIDANQPENKNRKKKQTLAAVYKSDKPRLKHEKQQNSHQSESQPKIYITNESFNIDFKLVAESFDQHLSELIPKWQQEDKLNDDEITVINSLLQEVKNEAFQKVINNIEILGGKSPNEQIVPIEVSLSRNVYRLNEMNMGNLKLACDRVAHEKVVKQQFVINPQLPDDAQIEVLMQDGSSLMLDEYIRMQGAKNIDEQIHEFEEYDKFVLETQKSFLEYISLYDRITSGFTSQLRSMDEDKGKRPKRPIRFF